MASRSTFEFPNEDEHLALAALVRSAAAGDQRAWETLFNRFTPAIRATARGFRLNAADVSDVVQATWLAAFQSLERLENPAAIGSWLVVTARRASLRTLQRNVRVRLDADSTDAADPDAPPLEAGMLERERVRALRVAVAELPDRQRMVLTALLARPGASYDELSSMLEMPIGSIGPTRERALARLRRDRRLAQVA